jgi:hypothetical protein
VLADDPREFPLIEDWQWLRAIARCAGPVLLLTRR